MFSYSVFTAAALAACWTAVSALEQPDVVGPAGKFEDSVSAMMTDEGVSRDVAEMFVAARMFSSNDSRTVKRLNNALRFMDDVQRSTANLYDGTYDDFLDLYPSWRTYLLSDEPRVKNAAFRQYQSLLDRYTDGQQNLIQGLGYLVAVQKALLPSNVFADPDKRIAPSSDETAALLDGF